MYIYIERERYAYIYIYMSSISTSTIGALRSLLLLAGPPFDKKQNIPTNLTNTYPQC